MGQKVSRSLPKTASKTVGVVSKRMEAKGISVPDPLVNNDVPKTHEERNTNADQFANRIRVDEIPLKLDENHPALKTLRNRKILDDALKQDTQETVRPGTFVAIVDDLQHYSMEEVQQRYKLTDEFVRILKNARFSVPPRVEVAEEKKSPEERAKEEEDFLNRTVEAPSPVENALDQLMRPK
ncbi:uncharacterized protein CYBJADRAFT_182212 [Cyberlindnera jadinii NRRL Y-1542]|uniref:Uncharacterized protein n=1 Tax=Cyberlindnera jadinii (strain ATCC 18201 / CBS 1600 / BCRC 20928 / JCM 3617 / NBRC 0987 / NRRL Y-1542) TaxID=983966 RepID=A0A1E4S9F3_CYBJN|nr:hypothetical protein CYBJADRAFT_182212 [Cyberlindnera jadinii NRRL Y-1542]ODV76012.1 hypothetical protein CYBJADRAFT_182212 [Cyberlindnera jadinii NRRL Y-1542]